MAIIWSSKKGKGASRRLKTSVSEARGLTCFQPETEQRIGTLMSCFLTERG